MSTIKNNSDKFKELRKRHERLIYHSFEVADNKIAFHFSIDDFHFRPEWTHDLAINQNDNADLLIFNLGMAELVSYWKCACPKIVEVRCGALSDSQIDFWKKLYRNGLGEFFYLNGIEASMDDFMQIHASGNPLPKPRPQNLDGCLIPVGGGKDSVVTLELLKAKSEQSSCFVVGNIKRAIDTAKAAGYPDSRIIRASRTIDPQLLELNASGYLNGHTPFSSVIAFSSLLFAYLSGKKYIVLSNESSANEGNVKDQDGVNHQYSKSLEFEQDFREYVAALSPNLPEYFSLLRPYSELKITEMFSRYSKYFNVFQSCNVGTKTNTWCNKCAKCLYVYIMLSAFLDDEVLVNIFGQDLLSKQELFPLLTSLASPEHDKPFECVGTRDEVNAAIHMAIARRKGSGSSSPLPSLLQDYKAKAPDLDVINTFDENNFVPKEFLRLLK